MASYKEHVLALEAQHQAERFYVDWRARRDHLQTEYDAEVKNEEYATRKAIAAVEAEFHRNMQVVAANGPQTVAMVEEVMSTKKELKIKELESRLRDTRAKMQAHYEKQLLDHTAKFSDAIMDRLKPLAANSPRQPASSATRHPASPLTGMSPYPRQPFGSNADSRLPIHDRNRQRAQPGSSPFRGGEYGTYPAQPRSLQEADYGRQPSQSRLSSEYPASVGPERHQPRWIYPPSQSQAGLNNSPGDGRSRHSLPSQQRILPSTPMGPEPQRVIDPLNTTGSVGAYQRPQIRSVDNSAANPHKAKRRSDALGDGHPDQEMPKRTRSVAGPSDKTQASPGDKAQGDAERDKADPPTPQPAPKAPAVKRTIDFNEVYQDGDAEYKHIIVMYPPGDSAGDWYILKCDEHGVHFNLNPMHGAAKHLHSSQHNNMSKEHSLAIRELGHLVWDCTKELAEKNNEAVKKAFDKGYKPFNRNQLSKTERRSMGFAVPETTPARRSSGMASAQSRARNDKGASSTTQIGGSKEFSGVAYPVDGELYLGYWSKNKTRYAVMLLPWGNLEPYTGIRGTLLGTGLLEKPPKCYTIDRVTQEIAGWAEGYEDGGRLVSKREFPVMYFDNPYKCSVGWVRAKDLTRFNFDDPNWRAIPYYDDARDRYASAQPEKFVTYESMVRYHATKGLPLKRLSDIRDPPATERTPEAQPAADDGAVASEEKGAGAETEGDKDTQPEGPAGAKGHGQAADVEMRDVSEADEADSDLESEPSDVPESDEDVEMGNAESRRTSVSNKAPGRDDGSLQPGQADKADKGLAGTPVTGSDVSATVAKPDAAAAARVRPGTSQSVENAAPGSDKDAGKASEEASAKTETHAPRPGSAGAGGSPALGPGMVATTSGSARSQSAPRIEDSIVHKRLRPNKTASTSGEGSQPSPVVDAAKSPVPSAPQGEASTGAALLRSSADGATPHDQQRAQGVKATEVSDSSSPISSPRSISPPPAAEVAPHTSSRTSTPTGPRRPDETAASDRWRAVRSESASRAVVSPPKEQPSEPKSVTDSATLAAKEPTTKEPAAKEASTPAAIIVAPPTATSRTSTPLPSKTAGEELFELAYYEDASGRKFRRHGDGPFLRVVVDKATNTCETAPGQSVQVKINPHDIARVQVDPLDDNPRAPCMVSLELKEGAEGPKKQQLVFENSKAMGREEAGRIHARRFCGWVKRVNAGIDYRNNTFNSSRPATGYTRD